MRKWAQIVDGQVVGQARLVDSAEPENLTEVENVTGELMGSTYNEQDGSFTNANGDIVAYAK